MTCAIYCRLSKEDEEKTQESESIQNQKSMLLKYALEQDWDVYNLYCDEDYSGVDRHRPAWNDMLNAAKNGKFSIILCKTQSRFTRDMELVEKYIHGLFPVWGIRFVAVVDNIDTDVKGNKKARQINGLINEWYLEDLSENIRAVFAQKRSAGQYIGSFPIYGYRKDPANHNHLLVDPIPAEVVRTIFSLSLQGSGKQHIACLLNERAILNPTAYKQSKGLNYHNGAQTNDYGLWNRTTVGRILRNEMYTGTMVQGTKRKVSYKSEICMDVPEAQWYRVEGTHEAIIDRDTYDAVQRLLDSRTRSDGIGEVHLLAGRVKCPDCGSPLIKISQNYKGNRRSYLQCKLYASSRTSPLCTKHTIRLDALTAAVEERIRQHVSTDYQLSDPARFLSAEDHLTRRREMQKELLSLQSQITKRSEAMRALYLDKVDGAIDGEQFMEMNRAFLAEKEKLQHRLDFLTGQAQSLKEQKQEASGISGRIQTLLKLDPMPRELIDLLIETIEVGEVQPDNTQEIHINWKI